MCLLPSLLLQAIRPSVSRTTGAPSGGAGGAIYLGLWGSSVLLSKSTFNSNGATQLGGAVYALAIDRSSIQVARVNASGNTAALEAPGSSEQQLLASTLRSEGGALHVEGSVATLDIINSTLEGNTAGRVSSREQGGLSVRGVFALQLEVVSYTAHCEMQPLRAKAGFARCFQCKLHAQCKPQKDCSC